MLPVGLAALVVKASLIGMNGVQPPRRAAGSAKYSKSRTRISTAGWLCAVCTGNAADARACRLDGGSGPLALAGGTPTARNSGRGQGGYLPNRKGNLIEIIDQFVKYTVPVDLGLQVQKHRTQADRGAVHEDEFARRPYPAEAADVAVHALGDGGAIDAARLLLNQALAIFQQRAVDKQRPPIEHIDYFPRQIAKPPTFVGMDGKVAITALQRVVEIDDAADEGSLEDADAAEIEEIDGAVRRDRVVAEVWVAVDDPVVIERHVPDPKHPQRNFIALLEWCLGDVEDRRAVEPGHRQQALGRQFGNRYRHSNPGLAAQDLAVKPHMRGFALVIEF